MADGIEAILAEAENPEYVRTATARVLIRQDLVARHAELQAELNSAIAGDDRENRMPVAPRVAEELLDLEAQIEQAKVEFRFRSVGRKAWADLLAKHPPTKEQVRADRRVDHNPATFPLAAIAASCVEPAMTVAEVERLERALNNSQFDTLWSKCIDANVGGLVDPKAIGASSIARRANSPSGDSATTTDEPSLAASSSDE